VPPVASAIEFIEVYKGEEILFDGSNSSDTPTDLQHLSFRWDFGDGETGVGKLVTHSYSEAGIYDAVLTVMDDDGDRGLTNIRVIIRDILLTGLTITADLEPDTCTPDSTVEISGAVDFDFAGVPKDYDISLAIVRIEILETGEFWRVTSDQNGQYELEFVAPSTEGTYTIKISITRLGKLAAETKVLTVDSSSKGNKVQGSYLDLNTTIIIAGVGCAGGLSAFTAGTDLGRYKYFSLLIPLYTRLNKSEVLDNFTRGRIYEHIRKNPGEHFSALKKILDINNGSLSYHLSVLEKEDYIQSRTDGFCKRFYPVGMKISKDQPTNIQELILQMISDYPAITQKRLANEIGVDVSTVNYHINMMTGAGIIASEKKGKTKHYYVLTEVEPVLEGY
jgi:DNA-binding MarR family transcriptional regulator